MRRLKSRGGYPINARILFQVQDEGAPPCWPQELSDRQAATITAVLCMEFAEESYGVHLHLASTVCSLDAAERI